MGIIRKTLLVAVIAAGGAAGSQAPEFAQQYLQRIGGAVDELRAVRSAFDADATRQGLNQSGALSAMEGSPEALVQDRGKSMRATFTRLEKLEEQAAALDAANPVMRPAIVAAYPDPSLVAGAWNSFAPAVPLTVAGATWGGFGALLALLLGGLTGSLTRRKHQRPQPHNGVAR